MFFASFWVHCMIRAKKAVLTGESHDSSARVDHTIQRFIHPVLLCFSLKRHAKCYDISISRPTRKRKST